MRCTQCGEREAGVELTQIANEQVVTLNLCERCAAEKGVETVGGLGKTPIGSFLASMGSVEEAGGDPDRAELCPHCGASLADFRQSGRLGCADCWHAFERPLRELVRRLHGSSRHVGRRYSAPGLEELRDGPSTEALREQLRLAVDAENFELATELRDRLRERE